MIFYLSVDEETSKRGLNKLKKNILFASENLYAYPLSFQTVQRVQA
jgi:hypothetical protein